MSIARTTFHASAFLLVFSSVCAGADTAGPDILPSGLAPEEVENRRYLDYARECVELLLRHGTDRYGEVHSPLLMNILDVRTRVASGYAQYEPRGHVDMWEPYVAGYENPIYTAQVYAFAYEQTKDQELLEAARRWAESIRRVFPPRSCQENTWYGPYAKDWAPHGTYAGLYGRTISFLLHLHSLAGEDEYRAFAREVAKEAVSKLYYQGLFRGHPAKPYYESVDGVGYLLYALVQLDQSLEGRGDGNVSMLNW